MADKPISQFPAASSVNASDVLAGVQEGVTKKFSLVVLYNAIVGWLGNTFVPVTRKVNNKTLSADITLDASDVGAYELPSGGIPKSDLAQGVQDSLDNADSAYQLPSGGIPSTDMASAVQTSLGLADSAYQLPSGGMPSSDMASAVQTSLGKADTAYQKPSAGIPSSDMTSAVQTSLGKADTAYQKPSSGIPASDLASGVIPSVPAISTSTPQMDGTGAAGSIGQVSDAGHTHPTDTSRAPVYGLGKNLLDNAYFLNPVNQRGQSSYSGAGYGIDRWASTRANTVTLESDGLKLSYSTGQGYQQITQNPDNPTKYNGKTLTLSALMVAVTQTTYLRYTYGPGALEHFITEIPSGTTGLVTMTVTVPSNATYAGAQLSSGATTPTSGYFKVAAIKLELGTEQTLAHQENGVWVLNEIPDYGEELAKCQRYLWIIDANDDNHTIAFGSATTTTAASFVIGLPVTMRQNKVLNVATQVISNTLPRVYSNPSNANKNASAITAASIIGNQLNLGLTINTATLGESMRLLLMQGSKLGVSLEL